MLAFNRADLIAETFTSGWFALVCVILGFVLGFHVRNEFLKESADKKYETPDSTGFACFVILACIIGFLGCTGLMIYNVSYLIAQ